MKDCRLEEGKEVEDEPGGPTTSILEPRPPKAWEELALEAWPWRSSIAAAALEPACPLRNPAQRAACLPRPLVRLS